MLDWLLAQAINLAVSVIISWLQHKGYTDAAQALGAKEAHEIIQDVKDAKTFPEFPTGKGGRSTG